MIDKRLNQEAMNRGRILLFLVLFAICGGLFAISQGYVIATIVNAAFLQNKGLSQLWGLLWLLLAIFIGRGINSFLLSKISIKLASIIKQNIRIRLVDKLANFNLQQRLKFQTGKVISLLTDGIDNIDAYYSKYLPQLLQAVIIPPMILIVVFMHNVYSGIIMLITAPLIPVFMNLIGSMADSKSRKQFDSLMVFSGHFLDILQGITTLKIFGGSKNQRQNIINMTNNFRDTTMEVLKIAFLSALMLEILATISTAMIAVEVGLRLVFDQLTFQTAFFVLLLAPELYLPLKNLGGSFHSGKNSIAAAEQIWQVLDQDNTITNNTTINVNTNVETAIKKDLMISNLVPNIKVDKLSFSYLNTNSYIDSNTESNTESDTESSAESDTESNAESDTESSAESNTESNVESNTESNAKRNVYELSNSDTDDVNINNINSTNNSKLVLNNISFEIKANQRVAIVGRSGSGKTTLLNLMLGLLPISSGDILINGISLSEYNHKSWLNNIAYVMQEPYIFAGSIIDNIKISNNAASDDDVKQAIIAAGVDLFVDELANGYNTYIGERGYGLSGGERQRIALARAFLKKAPIVVLDEPTSGLDLETEYLLLKAINQLSENSTVITVAHHLQTVVDADLIIVLAEGQIVATGTHEELSNRSGLYREIVSVYRGDRHE